MKFRDIFFKVKESKDKSKRKTYILGIPVIKRKKDGEYKKIYIFGIPLFKTKINREIASGFIVPNFDSKQEELQWMLNNAKEVAYANQILLHSLEANMRDMKRLEKKLVAKFPDLAE